MLKLHQGRWQDHLPETIDCVVTDPPYNTTGCSWDGGFVPEEFWSLIEPRLHSDSTVVMTCQMRLAVELINTSPLRFRHDLVWEKPNGTGQVRTSPNRVHEQIVVFGGSYYEPQMQEGKPYSWRSTRSKGEATGYSGSGEINNEGTRHPRSVLHYAQERGLHPTQKPIKLFEFLIQSYCDPKWCVFEPFLGSGTTLVACQRLGRSAIGVEQDPKYFKTAQNRIQKQQKFDDLFE